MSSSDSDELQKLGEQFLQSVLEKGTAHAQTNGRGPDPCIDAVGPLWAPIDRMPQGMRSIGAHKGPTASMQGSGPRPLVCACAVPFSRTLCKNCSPSFCSSSLSELLIGAKETGALLLDVLSECLLKKDQARR